MVHEGLLLFAGQVMAEPLHRHFVLQLGIELVVFEGGNRCRPPPLRRQTCGYRPITLGIKAVIRQTLLAFGWTQEPVFNDCVEEYL